jgi:pimeloyl-ACP methyl ester carboxylesterase
LSVVPATGHLVSLEEPDLFNRMTESFFALVEARKWRAQERA